MIYTYQRFLEMVSAHRCKDLCFKLKMRIIVFTSSLYSFLTIKSKEHREARKIFQLNITLAVDVATNYFVSAIADISC